MDTIYELVEGVHIFIPIVAVIFVVLMIFMCGTTGRVEEPDEAYLNKLNALDNRKERKQRAPAPSKTLPLSPNKSSTSTTQRKKTNVDDAKATRRGENIDTAPEIQEHDNGWVTVTPKRKQRMPKAGGSTSIDDDMFDDQKNDDEMMVLSDDRNEEKVVEVPKSVIEQEKTVSTPPPQPPVDKVQPVRNRSHKKKQTDEITVAAHQPLAATFDDIKEAPIVAEKNKTPVDDDDMTVESESFNLVENRKKRRLRRE